MKHEFRIVLPKEVTNPRVEDVTNARLVLLRDGRQIAHESFSTEGEMSRANLTRWMTDMVPPDEHAHLMHQFCREFVQLFAQTEANGVSMELSNGVLMLRPIVCARQPNEASNHPDHTH